MKTLSKSIFGLLIALVIVLSLAGVQPAGAVTATQRMTFRSIAAQDGFIWESTETSGVGLRVNSTGTTFRVGDDLQNRQYVGVLSFNTSRLPDNAVITWARVRIQHINMAGLPNFGTEVFEVISPYFGTSAALQPSDFQAAASAQLTGQGINVNQYLTMLFGSGEFQFINLQGITQIRLKRSVDDNDNNSADYFVFYSSEVANAAARPTLVVEYYIP